MSDSPDLWFRSTQVSRRGETVERMPRSPGVSLRRLTLATVASLMAGCREPQPAPCFIEFALEPEPEPLYPEPTECDPFVMPQPRPHIQPPVVVARTGAGQVYVVDRLDNGFGRPDVEDSLVPRVFVEEEGVLVRVTGSTGDSESTSTHLFDAFGSAEEGILGMIRVERAPDRAYPRNIVPHETAVVLFDGPTEGETPAQKFEGGTRIEVLSECEVAEHEVVGLPQSRRTEYAAEDELGNVILVAVPVVDWDVESAFLFYGPPDAVLQRPVLSFGRERDGGTTHIRFELDGQESTLHFWVGSNGPFTHDCEGTLELPDQELTVSIPSRDPGLPDGRFICHDEPAALSD